MAPRRAIKARTSAAPPRKRVKTEVDDSERPVFLSDSGESEREEDADDADDDETDDEADGDDADDDGPKKESGAPPAVARRGWFSWLGGRPTPPPPTHDL